MAQLRTPRSSWISAGLQALAEGGPDAVRIEPLAKTIGVTKGGFYWHFEGRDALLEEMLDEWERFAVDDVIDRVEAEGGDRQTRLQTLFGLASEGREILSIDLAVRDWARRDPEVEARLRRVDNRRMDYMRELFAGVSSDPEDVEARCLIAFSLWIGNHFVAAEHGELSRGRVMRAALDRLGASQVAR